MQVGWWSALITARTLSSYWMYGDSSLVNQGGRKGTGQSQNLSHTWKYHWLQLFHRCTRKGSARTYRLMQSVKLFYVSCENLVILTPSNPSEQATVDWRTHKLGVVGRYMILPWQSGKIPPSCRGPSAFTTVDWFETFLCDYIHSTKLVQKMQKSVA